MGASMLCMLLARLACGRGHGHGGHHPFRVRVRAGRAAVAGDDGGIGAGRADGRACLAAFVMGSLLQWQVFPESLFSDQCLLIFKQLQVSISLYEWVGYVRSICTVGSSESPEVIRKDSYFDGKASFRLKS
ncbi:unnamed protein product [Sphagnum tenellum]